MSETIKRLYNAGIAKETTRNTKATPTCWITPTMFDIQDRIEVVKSERSTGRREARNGQAVAKSYSQGAIEGEIFDKTIGYLLLGAYGSVSSAPTGDTGVYEHNFSVIQNALIPTFTIVEKRADVEQVAYVGSVLETLGITLEIGNYAKFSANFKGKPKVADTSTPSYVSENSFMTHNAKIKFADDYAGLDGASDFCLTNLTLEYGNAVQDEECIGNVSPVNYLGQDFTVAGDLEMYFKTSAERDWALNQISKAMRITVEDTNVTIGSTSHPKLVLNFANVMFEEPELSSDMGEIVRLAMKFEAHFSPADSLETVATLTNTTASY